MEGRSRVTAMFVQMVNAVITTYQSIKFVTATFNNVRANGYQPSTITVVSPYGQGSVPIGSLNGLLIPIEESNKLYVNIGFAQVVPPIPYTFVAGESWQFSQGYVFAQQNTGLMAYRVSDDSYSAYIPSGNWTNKILTDIITRLTQIETLYNEHTHTGVTTGMGTSGTVTTPMPDDTDLSSDQSAINDGHTLIADGGTTP